MMGSTGREIVTKRVASLGNSCMEFGSKDENHNIVDFLRVLGKDRHMIGSELPLSNIATLNMVRWS